MDEFYKNICIDFIHQAISIPGVAMRVCFPPLILQQNFISLILRIKIYIICSKRTLLVDLASTIFNQYHESGKTSIQNKPCQKIIGYDANALYLRSTGQNFPAGYPLIRHQEKHFVHEFPHFQEVALTGLTG